jgi:hypothetical protein
MNLNLSTLAPVSRRAVLGTLAAAMLATGGIGISRAHADSMPTITAPGPGQVRIATDKPAYAIGDPIRITYTVPGPGRIVITDHQATGVSTLRAERVGVPGKKDPEVRGEIKGTVTPPAGKECLKLEYTDDAGATSVAETCFQVKEPAEPGGEKAPDKTPPGQGQPETPKAPDKVEASVLGLQTVRNKATDQMLDSNTDKKVYPLNANGGSFQKWMLEAGPDGRVFLRNLATGYYLDSNEQEVVYTHVKNGGAYQQWKLEPGTDVGYFVLRNHQTGLVLIDSSGLIHTGKLAAGVEPSSRAQWKLTPTQP